MPTYRELVGLSFQNEYIRNYTSSISHDDLIFREAINIIAAHTSHLLETGIINKEAYCKTIAALTKILDDGSDGVEQNKYEDIWEYIETKLHKLTRGVSDSIWIGRSRNDHVSMALRMLTYRITGKILENLLEIRYVLLERAEKEDIIIPLHTHMQPSQAAPVQCLLLSWEETISTISTTIFNILPLVLRSTLGSSAGGGTTINIDKVKLGEKLGLNDVIWNPLYATGSRLDIILLIGVIVTLLSELSKIAEDLIMYSNPYIQIIDLPSEHVSTSSAMPHKRNPVTLEVLRARAKKMIGLYSTILNVNSGIPSGYSLDLQELNPTIYEIMETTLESSNIIKDILRRFKWNNHEITRTLEKYPLTSLEIVEILSIKKSQPFRQAYIQVAKAINEDKLVDLTEKLHMNIGNIIKNKACGNIDHAKKRIAKDKALLEEINGKIQQLYRVFWTQTRTEYEKICEHESSTLTLKD